MCKTLFQEFKVISLKDEERAKIFDFTRALQVFAASKTYSHDIQQPAKPVQI